MLGIFLDYFDERSAVYTLHLTGYGYDMTWLTFPRPISSYLNELTNNKLVFKEMSEPKPSEDLVEKNPRDGYLDDNIRPKFLIIKTIKKSEL